MKNFITDLAFTDQLTTLASDDTILVRQTSQSKKNTEISVTNFFASNITPHIALLDTTSQSIAVANTPQVITFNTLDFADKIVQTSSSRFTVLEGGNFIANISAQTELQSGANKLLDIWIKVNGTNLANSNSKIRVANGNDQKRLTISIPFTLNTNDYVELWMSGNDVHLRLLATGVETTPDRPATPSIFLTIDKLP
jgi:hypothetical protein